jgi:hypothetical protein
MWDDYRHPTTILALALEGATVLVIEDQDPSCTPDCGISTYAWTIYFSNTYETDCTNTVRCRPLCRYLLCCISAELSVYLVDLKKYDVNKMFH